MALIAVSCAQSSGEIRFAVLKYNGNGCWPAEERVEAHWGLEVGADLSSFMCSAQVPF